MRLEGLRRDLFTPGQRVSCALSGGADSTALLLALHDANQEKHALGLVLSAIHIHHGLRGAEADADAHFVQQLCADLGVPLTTQHVDTPAHQAATGEGLEEAARTLRHRAFATLVASGKAEAIATAHTLDDQAETVVMKLLRGAWTDGLSGIAGARELTETPTPVPLLRPLLGVRRAEIEQFLTARGQPWQTDSSNADLTLTRNRIRHQLMPMLRTFNPAIDSTLSRLAELAGEDELYWQAEATRILPSMLLPGKAVRGGGRAVGTGVGERAVAVDLERLRAQPAPLRRRLLRRAAAEVGSRPGADETAKLLALAGLLTLPGISPRNGARLDLGNGLRAERSIRELRLSRSAPPSIPKKV